MTPTLDLTDKDALIAALVARNEEQRVRIEDLFARIADLEAKLGLPPKTPDNSSVPPSKGQKPSGSTPPKSKAKPHRGAHRLLHPNPTRTREVLASACQGCGTDVSGVEQSPCETYDRVEILHWTDATETVLPNGVAKRILAGQNLSLVMVRIPAGTVAARHSHPFEQFVQVISGSGRLETEQGSLWFEAGSVFHFPPEAWHEALFETETVLIESNIEG